MDQRTLASRLALSAAACAALSALASAQSPWLSFTQDNSRISAAPGVSTSDPEEKDYYVGDVDNDGDPDLVCVRKQPFTTAGPETNVLFINENGVLTDRTATHANKSDVPGDQGFLTATNDRDVELVDVDNDGWLDIVTATTLGGGQPQHISHPRVYMNLGAPGGTWLGFEHQAARFPQFFTTGGTPTCPKFCGMSSGDLTGDGFADLYFSDYDTGSSCAGDLNDRLMINDGTGHFVDESALRMTPAMLESAFGTSAQIADFNMDGKLDIMKSDNSGKVQISYQDPNNPGTFDTVDNVNSGATYHASSPDLNGDGRPDLLVSDDGDDKHIYNMGTDVFGRAIWSVAQTFIGPDLGFASDNYGYDMDNDGHVDSVFADVDVDIGGCNRRMQIFRNLGGAVGSVRQMREETGAGWVSAQGFSANDLEGMHDFAVLDLDGDGDKDLVLGRCSGMDVWMNNLDPVGGGVVGTIYCACSSSAPCSNTSASGGCVNSTGSGALLTGSGSTSVSFNDLTLSMSPMANNEFGIFFTGSAQIGPFSFGDGQRCVGGSVFRFPLLNSGPAGALTLSSVTGIATANFGAGGLWGTGSTWHFQGWYRDPGGPCASSFNLSNGLSLLLTP